MGLIRALRSVPSKAAVGPGVYAMQTYAPLRVLSQSPQKLMHEAQLAYRQYVWVNAAERAINSRLARVGYHLERPDGGTVTAENATPGEQAVIQLIDHPNSQQQRASTRRGLWGLASRHVGLAGNGFLVLDQQDALNGIPLALLYVNPVRMTPAEDANGNLLGWVVDDPRNPVTGRPGRTGMPLQLDEVEQLVLDEPDSGHFGIGIVEAALTKIELSRLADRHAAQVLGSGGRLAGLMSPKERDGLNAEQWEATVRAWRSIVDDPDAAKRLHIVKGPVDFTPTAAKPAEMELADLAKMSRSDILAAWHVPESQIGIHGTTGLNSGDTIKFEEAAFWQGPIEDRVAAIREPLQRIIDRFRPAGVQLKLVVETPSFDDEAPLYENATKAKVIPLTVNQRLELVGKDPLDPKRYGDFGDAIFIDKSMVRIDPNAPAPVVPPQLAPFTGQPPADEEDDTAEPKASLEDELRALRSRFESSVTPELRSRLAAVFEEMRGDLTERVERFREHLAANPADTSVWWNEPRWRGRLLEALSPVGAIAGDVATAQSARFRADAGAKADDWIERVSDYVRTRGAERVTGMLRTIRDGLQKVILGGVRDNLTAAQLGEQIEQAAVVDEYRAELIARTELMSAYNDASLRTFREFGADRVQAQDGDDDAECAARNGEIYTLDEASAISDHPNGTLDWSPVV